MINYKEKIGIGTVQFGMKYGISNSNGQTSENEVSQILNFAKNNGIDTIDTAFLYGDAQKSLGLNDLSFFKIISKFSINNSKDIEYQLTNSLSDLNVKSLYGFLSHHPNQIIENTDIWEELKMYKSNGIVKKIGFSLNTPNELDQLLDLNCIPDLIQVPFNYLDNRFETQIKLLKNKGCEIHTRSTFLQGLFFKPTEQLPHFFDEIKPIIRTLQEEYKQVETPLMKYVLEKDYIDKVIIGIENLDQLKTNYNLNFKETKSLNPIEFNISDQIIMPMYWPKNN